MPGMRERVYPNEMHSSRALETLMKGVFLRATALGTRYPSSM